MHGTITEPKELEPLSKLTHVSELYVPARVWSPVSDVKAPFADESFQYYQGMKELEKFHAGLTTLAWLDIGDEGVKRLTPLTQLKDLRLNNTTIKDPKCFEGLINLESLDLGDAYVLDHSLVPLAKMKNLRRLNLLGTLVTDEGLKHLSGLTELEDLDLYGVKVTDSGIEHLSKLKKLRRLNLLGAQISDASAGILSGLEELRELNLYRSRITNAGLAKTSSVAQSGTDRLAVHRCHRRRRGCAACGAAECPGDLCGYRPSGHRPRKLLLLVVAVLRRSQSGCRRWAEPSGRGEKGIHYISLARTRLTDAEIKYLASVAGLSRNSTFKRQKSATLPWIRSLRIRTLKDLNLSFTGVSDRGLERLAPLVNLQQAQPRRRPDHRLRVCGVERLEAAQDPGPRHQHRSPMKRCCTSRK